MAKEKLALLGATGSIGRSAMDVVRAHPDRYEIWSMSAGSRVEELVEAACEFKPRRVSIGDAAKKDELARGLAQRGLSDVEVLADDEGNIELASDPAVDRVLQAVVGARGVPATFAAVEAGKKLLLANKESVVCGGALLMRRAAECGAEIIPVDSEHSAVFQCLKGAEDSERRAAKIILTASGGPFRGRKTLEGITPEQAVKHPKWSMGRKISIDSATLMNKGLEVIEASWLFGFPGERIDVVVHPQSIIHSMVEFEDGAVIAQLGAPDMKTPIAYAMGWPERLDGGAAKLDFARLGALTFEAPDGEVFPLLDAAYAALKTGTKAQIALNAANEVAVEAFLDHRIGFTDIFRVAAEELNKSEGGDPENVEEILSLDQRSRAGALELINKL